MTASRLKRRFFDRPTLTVARELLGQRLVRLDKSGNRLSGVILETEAYIGADDLSCHARAGRTDRNASMWGPPGHAYVYFTYGMHWLLNIVTEPEGFPAAVLIRAVFPVEGIEVMQKRRLNRPRALVTNGPAKLCQALSIDGRLNAHDLCDPASCLFLERETTVPDSIVTVGPRVGLFSVPEPWKSMPWRFKIHHGDFLAEEGSVWGSGWIPP